MDVEAVTIELTIGHTDKKGAAHKRVTIGRRITGKELFLIDDDPQSNIPTQHQSLLLRAQITEFGEMRMPVPMSVLLDLDSLDMDDLAEAANRFREAARGDRKSEPLAANKIRLAFGYERNGLVYDVVEFGRRLTGMDDVEADRQALTDIRRVCFLAGRQIAKLSQSDGASVLEGPFEAAFLMQLFAALDSLDIVAMRLASEAWRQSFRRARASVSQNGSGADGVAAGEGDGVERADHTVAAK